MRCSVRFLTVGGILTPPEWGSYTQGIKQHWRLALGAVDIQPRERRLVQPEALAEMADELALSLGQHVQGETGTAGQPGQHVAALAHGHAHPRRVEGALLHPRNKHP